ncbi:uncharacterized protein BJ212DRAFT_1398930 [Suillus subaureus]|uniref:F-box domain-containing protein n=1 Tax=Suillus subaureus TaxID=48587 RepID=A0A9P7DS94_9AGAM|nr:uncharacterized protein BJ212DRAFT_1398930 [Suillus subaureus]KAG1801736.1 hypothetical protein BJ212DRAFT_1398930 [Suillus subaureus]
MHQCLYLEEILQEIFKNADSRSLTVLARTCRLFYEPTLNVIYSDLSGLQPLIERLPRDLWSTSSGELVIQRPLRPQDWEVFASYSRRVRSLRLRWFASDAKLYRALLSPPNTSFLLPNLRTFTWHCLSTRSAAGLDDMLVFMRLIFCHNLAAVQLIVSEYALAAFSDLGCTSLRQLVIQNHKVAISANVTEDAIHKLSALRSLACGEVSVRALHHLAQFPSLSRLTIWLGDDIPSALAFPRFPFSKLRYLTINTKSIGPCLSMLKATNWNIRCFHHRMDAGYDPAGRKVLLELLPLQLSRESLKCISLHTSTPHRDDDPITNPFSLKPLFSFKNLLILELIGAILPELDNDGLRKLAIAWPQLRVLILHQKAGLYRAPQVDLTGLVLLLEHCTKLHQLALSVNAIIDTKAPPTPPISSISNKLITFINFSNSPITKTAEVAAFLSAIVPNLRETLSWTGEVMCPGGSVQEYRKRWDDVAELVRVFAEVRKQEREACMHALKSEGVRKSR